MASGWLHSLLDELAAKQAAATAVVCRSVERAALSYGDIRARSLLLAAGLGKLQAQSGSGVLAIHLSRTHPDFVPIMVAASRLQLPFVLLSTDLPDKKLQETRNQYILNSLRPSCRIVPRSLDPSTAPGEAELAALCPTILAIGDIARAGLGAAEPTASDAAGTKALGEDVLCFMFTGGTHRTKIVKVTHAMFLHERAAYWKVWRPSSRRPAVVMAHTSVYWGASALGQWSIALAYGGIVVWTEATEAMQLRRCVVEENVSVLGVVPDHLDLLAPEAPLKDLPAIEVVFTWGERLPRRLAERWRGHPTAVLRELLISTEYWLTLWADPLDGSTVLRSVPGAEIFVMKEDGTEAAQDETGELFIAGPMLMGGYHQSPHSGEAALEDPFVVLENGKRYFRTRDLVRKLPGGIQYKGRADMMAKHKGKWVDMLAMEDQLAQLQGVKEARLVADPRLEHFHAFVSLDEAQHRPGQALNSIRMALPPTVQLWLLPALPRHPVTRKVDVSKLSTILNGLPVSWPVEGTGSLKEATPLESERLRDKLYSCLAWQLTAVGSAWCVVADSSQDSQEWLAQLTLATAWFATVSYLKHCTPVSDLPTCKIAGGNPRRGEGELGSRPATVFAVTFVWVGASLLGAGTGLPSTPRMVRGIGSLVLFTYGWLAMSYADGFRHQSSVAKATMEVVDRLPCWKFGAFMLLSCSQRLPGVLGQLGLFVHTSCATYGAYMAASRGRLLNWPIVFWSFGVGHQMGMVCDSWLEPLRWWRHSKWMFLEAYEQVKLQISRLAIFRKPEQSWRRGGGEKYAAASPKADGDESSPAVELCPACQIRNVNTKWPAKDNGFRKVCDQCGTASVEEYERSAEAFLTEVVERQAAAAAQEEGVTNGEPSSKVARTESSTNGVEPRKEQRRNGGDRDDSVRASARGKDSAKGAEETSEEEDKKWAEWASQHKDSAMNWWWFNKTETSFDISADKEPVINSVFGPATPASSSTAAAPVPPEMRMLCAVLGDIEPLLKPVNAATILVGIDSLQVARLANAIKIRMGAALTVQQLREARTVAELHEAILTADKVADDKDSATGGSNTVDEKREYAVWWSPGQNSPMGAWVLRTEEPFDFEALKLAAQQITDRHVALRAMIAEPGRYMSILYDIAVLFTLYGPVLDRGPLPARWFRRFLSKQLQKAWPRFRIHSREELYAVDYPETKAPLQVHRLYDGQDDFEFRLRKARGNMRPPGELHAYEVVCDLCDAWEFTLWSGRFVILPAPSGLKLPAEVRLVYVDKNNGEWGPLLAPGCEGWQQPPYGFPPLFFAKLTSGAIMWLRLEKRDELRVCYRASEHVWEHNHHLVAFRSARCQRPRRHAPISVNMVSFGMYHIFADGNCYLPLVQDFMNLYDSARKRAATPLPRLTPAFQELEKRVFDTFDLRQNPLRSSLRGSLWQYHGQGYGYSLGLGPGMIAILNKVTVHYRVPLDVALLGIVACAKARADKSDFVDLTLYVPMRDGADQAMLVGLFSDWRDLYVSVDFDLATVLGTILQLTYKIQHRHWTPFNALRKPERTVVNMQPMDFETRAGFKNLGENMWRGGDKLNENERRDRRMPFCAQPGTFVIEQQDEGNWWVLASAGHDERPTPWMRQFVLAFEEALHSFLYEPLKRVHMPFPRDEQILWELERNKKWGNMPKCVDPPASWGQQ
eukprot:TRINITY_DN17063_c0_g1_i1.p1 TRINITY_DN17063_c0_g1~~TRINITY_DN17063_c0_g1_i1.p1  ORF type:complete len:1678 (+),score=343.86 TRINITY_DN17063_c0_g1_i1:108-5141(+)